MASEVETEVDSEDTGEGGGEIGVGIIWGPIRR